MALKLKETNDSKKRRRVGFADIDAGVEANDCMKVFLVRSPEEVGSTTCKSIDPFDLNHFFGEDAKIYGYKDLKINVWLSAISFHAYAEISSEGTCDGGKGITDLKPALQNIFGETLVEKEEFLQTFSKENEYLSNVLSNGTVFHCYSLQADDKSGLDGEVSTVEIVRTEVQGTAAFLYSRLVPLVLLLVEGSTPIDITEPGWEMLLLVKKSKCPAAGGPSVQLLGFAVVYHFYHYPESSRLRMGQILVLPPYQSLGHGRRLLEAINSIALSDNIYDLTIEDPSDYLQYLRTCVDSLRLLTLEPLKPAVDSVVSHIKESNLSKRTCKSRIGPPANLVEIVRQKFKITKKQFLRCWEVLIYLNLNPEDHKSIDNFRACIFDRLKSEIVDNGAASNVKRLVQVPSAFGDEMSFVVFRSPAGEEADAGKDVEPTDEEAQAEQLNKLVDSQMEDITAVAKKVSLLCKSDN